MGETLRQILRAHTDLLISGGLELTGKRFIGLFRPGVYIISKGKRPLYVGKCTGKLIKRIPIGKNDALDNATALQTVPCKSAKAAGRLEEILITELQPEYNTIGKHPSK
jgi:excinuclease UvrABC nuclease subunit